MLELVVVLQQVDIPLCKEAQITKNTAQWRQYYFVAKPMTNMKYQKLCTALVTLSFGQSDNLII